MLPIIHQGIKTDRPAEEVSTENNPQGLSADIDTPQGNPENIKQLRAQFRVQSDILGLLQRRGMLDPTGEALQKKVDAALHTLDSIEMALAEEERYEQ